MRERGEVRRDRDQALPGAGRGGEDQVRVGDDLDDRLVLRRVELDALPLGPVEEREVDAVRVGFRRDPVGQRCDSGCSGDVHLRSMVARVPADPRRRLPAAATRGARRR